MLHDDLLGVARQLASLDASGKPRQATLRRSVSTAYYALFHALCDACVGQLVGWNRGRSDFWAPITPIYRAIDHSSARRFFAQILRNPSQDGNLRRLAAHFLKLQEERLRAGYDPSLRCSDRRRWSALKKRNKRPERSAPETHLQLVVQLLAKPR